MARPTKLNPKIAAAIVEFIRAGNYLETAAACAGIDRRTLHRWLKIGGRMKGGPHYDFAQAVMQASGEAEARDVGVITAAAVDQWQAAAWRLERKHSQRWGRKERTELTGANGGPVQVHGPLIYIPPERED